MAEPGRVEVSADPSCSGSTEVRMLQVPSLVPAMHLAAWVFLVSVHTHTHTRRYRVQTCLSTWIPCSQNMLLVPVPVKGSDGPILLLLSLSPSWRGLKLAIFEYIHKKKYVSLYQLTFNASLSGFWPWTYESLRAHSSHPDLLSR